MDQIKYRDLFDQFPESCVITDLAGVIVDTNDKGRELLGRSFEELTNLPFSRLISDEHRERFGLHLARMATGNQVRNPASEITLTLQLGGQSAIQATLTAFPINGDDQELEFLGWSIRNGRDNTEKPITEDQKLLQAILRALPVGIMISDAEGKIVKINPTGKEILGSDIQGTLNKPYWPHKTYFPDGRPLLPEDMPLNAAINEGRSVEGVEIISKKDDGNEVAILSSGAPVYDEDENLIRGVAIFQDITALKNAQNVLQLYANALNTLHEIDKAILGAVTLNSLISKVLPLVDELIPFHQISVLAFKDGASEAKVLGLLASGHQEVKMGWYVPLGKDWPPGDLAQNEIMEIAFPGDLKVHPQLGQVLFTPEAETLMSVPLIDRGALIGALNVSLDTDEHPAEVLRPVIVQVANQLAIGIRQTKLIQTQKRYTGELEDLAAQRGSRLNASEARFRTVFEDAVFGIALLDENGLILDSNQALQRILGYSGGEIIGKSLLDYGFPEDVGTEQELFAQLIQNEIEYFEYEGRFIREGGDIRWGKHFISRVKEEKHEEPTVAIALVEDFTERVLNQEALLRTERFAIAGRLGASLAHEINNPLQAVLGSLGLIEEMIDEQEALKFLSVAMDELERAAKIVEQLRDLGRPIIEKEKERVDLNSLIEKTLILTKKKRESTKIELVWKKIENLPLITVSADQIQQVFLNLVVNAIQAMENGGTLEISTELTEGPEGILTIIRDDGDGISSDVQMKLFEPFFSSRPDGLGLGLYISHQIVQQHKGKIHVESEEGLGAVVSVWLPIDEKT